jgi:hypothetical protein
MSLLSRLLARRRSRPGARPAPRPGPGLDACLACGSPYVVPVGAEVDGDSHWWLRLRCGECEEVRELIVPNETAQRFEAGLGAEVAALARLAERVDIERELAEWRIR